MKLRWVGGGGLGGALAALVMMTLGAGAETAAEALARADAALQAAAPRALADPTHPIFHVASPAQWMNDPNGPIYYRGYYHLFYQLYPYADEGGNRYWGHVRSRDLVHWEPLPVALAPSNERGEEAVWSGCCTVNGRGQPMIFYTSIGVGKSPFDQATQWAAVGDADLLHWRKVPENPVLPESVNNGKKVFDWRDPFIFHEGKHTFLVTGGHLAKERGAAVSIYEALNPELTQWQYRGVLFHHPDPAAPTVECPNFFPLAGHWVLFVSPYGKVQYFIGDFDVATCRFTARTRGLVDYGSSFYAPNTMQVPDGRRLVWGWVKDFPGGHGWNGVLSVPRQLSVLRDGQLGQTPAPQLRKLRGKEMEWPAAPVLNTRATFALPATNAMEIQADLELRTAKGVRLEIADSANEENVITITWDGAELGVLDARAPLSAGDMGHLQLRIFLDRSVLEVFANETVCVTKTIRSFAAGSRLTVQATDHEAYMNTLRAWPMTGIWPGNPVRLATGVK